MIADNVAVTSVPRVKFLHRFATDEIDASDIARVVNESYDVECSVNGQHSFRQPGPKISASEVSTISVQTIFFFLLFPCCCLYCILLQSFCI
jgi:hypothetical protein